MQDSGYKISHLENLCFPLSGTVFQCCGNKVKAEHPQSGKDFSSLRVSCRFITGKMKFFQMKVTRCDPWRINEFSKNYREGLMFLYCKVKGKGKVVPFYSTKTYRGSWGIAPLIFNLGTRWRWVVKFTFRPLYPRKTRRPLEAGSTAEPFGTVFEGRKYLTPDGI